MEHYYQIYVDNELMDETVKAYSCQDAIERYVNAHAAECVNKTVLAYKIKELSGIWPLADNPDGYTSVMDALENGLK